MNEKKLPYIPLMIGDWEQDTNVLSLVAEGGLIKLTFKLWKAKPRGRIEITMKSISNLFRMPESEAQKIIDELRDNEILNMQNLSNGKLEIISRRHYVNPDLSRVRSESAKNRWMQNECKDDAKNMQPLETDTETVYETDIDIVNERKGGAGGKEIADRKLDFINRLSPFIEKYEKGLLIEFAEYWTETNKSETKMRFEGERYFDVARRLGTFHKNEIKWERIKKSGRDYNQEWRDKFSTLINRYDNEQNS
jgi:hypothetical protein